MKFDGALVRSTSSISCGAKRCQLHAVVERSSHDAGSRHVASGTPRRHFVAFRLGFLFAAADLMIKLPFPSDDNGILA